MAKDKAVDKAVAKVSPGYDAVDDRKWKVDGAMRDIMAAEAHKKDKDTMKGVKCRIKDLAKALGC